jgi:hypothetical protein
VDKKILVVSERLKVILARTGLLTKTNAIFWFVFNIIIVSYPANKGGGGGGTINHITLFAPP